MLGGDDGQAGCLADRLMAGEAGVEVGRVVEAVAVLVFEIALGPGAAGRDTIMRAEIEVEVVDAVALEGGLGDGGVVHQGAGMGEDFADEHGVAGGDEMSSSISRILFQNHYE